MDATELKIHTATFEQLHADGAERFGLDWLHTNPRLVTHQSKYCTRGLRG